VLSTAAQSRCLSSEAYSTCPQTYARLVLNVCLVPVAPACRSLLSSFPASNQGVVPNELRTVPPYGSHWSSRFCLRKSRSSLMDGRGGAMYRSASSLSRLCSQNACALLHPHHGTLEVPALLASGQACVYVCMHPCACACARAPAQCL